MLRFFCIFCILFSFIVTPSFSLTESVNLFGEINSADIILNDIWIEPENPKNGEPVAIHGSVYNAGIISTEDVTDAVTIAYIINGEIVKIDLLENIMPGLENGKIVSSGHVFNAMTSTYKITVIANYHDTLSHLRDNPRNNIVQKTFEISNELPSIVEFDVLQHYNEKTNKQEITIRGNITNILEEGLKNEGLLLEIEGFGSERIKSDENGEFQFHTDMEFSESPVKILTHVNENSFITSQIQEIFPIKMNTEQSALAIKIKSHPSESGLNELPLVVVLFQDEYSKLFEKKSTEPNSKDAINVNNLFLTTLPSEHKYIAEIYAEGRIIDAFQNYFPSNTVIKKDIDISESAQIQFRVLNETGKPEENVDVKTWIYHSKTNDDGISDWINVIPTFSSNEPYVAKAVFPNGEVSWSKPFLLESEEKKIITIIRGGMQ